LILIKEIDYIMAKLRAGYSFKRLFPFLAENVQIICSFATTAIVE
jgi:hypothetical protein